MSGRIEQDTNIAILQPQMMDRIDRPNSLREQTTEPISQMSKGSNHKNKTISKTLLHATEGSKSTRKQIDNSMHMPKTFSTNDLMESIEGIQIQLEAIKGTNASLVSEIRKTKEDCEARCEETEKRIEPFLKK